MAEEAFEEIEFDKLDEGIKNGSLTVIDVRNPEEIASHGKIPGSINIPLPEVPDVFRNLTDEEFTTRFGFQKSGSGKPLVFTCRSGGRAKAAIDNLLALNIDNNYLLYAGSFTDWTAKGGQVDSASN